MARGVKDTRGLFVFFVKGSSKVTRRDIPGNIR